MLAPKVILLLDIATHKLSQIPPHFIKNLETLKGFELKDSHFKTTIFLK